jgi:hypothetical protein
MSVLICSPKYGGCGHVATHNEWFGDGDYPICPMCIEDHTFCLSKDNFASLTVGMSATNVQKAEKLLQEHS